MSEFTVSQLLAAADRDARQLLGHTTPDDGPALTAAWPDLLRVAVVLLANAPQPGTAQTSDHPPTLDDHVHSMLAEATAAPPLRLPPPHGGCARIIDTWYEAAAQTSRAAHPPATNDRVLELGNQADPVAVRTRVARTLATVAHLAGRELQAHTQRRVDVDAAGPRPNWVMSKGNPPPGNIEAQWIRMLHRHEHHALDHIAVPSTGSRSGLGEPSQRAPGPGPTLPGGVATWSIAALRQSTDPHSGAADLRRIALTQRAALYATVALAHAAVHRGEIPGEAGPHLQARIDAAAQGWADMAEQWSWAQVTHSREPTQASADVSRTLFATIDTDLRGNRTRWLSPGDVDNRFAGVPLVPMLRTILESNEILAEVYQQLPDQLHAEGRLRAPGSVLLKIYRETALNPSENPSRLPIDPRYLARNQLQRLTPAAHGRLQGTADALVNNAERAHHALLVSAGPAAATPARPATTAWVPTARPHRPARPHRVTRPTPDPNPGPGIPR